MDYQLAMLQRRSRYQWNGQESLNLNLLNRRLGRLPLQQWRQNRTHRNTGTITGTEAARVPTVAGSYLTVLTRTGTCVTNKHQLCQRTHSLTKYDRSHTLTKRIKFSEEVISYFTTSKLNKWMLR